MSLAHDAFQAELARLRDRPAKIRRDPILAVLAVWAARLVASLPRMRTALLSVAGFGLLSAAAWMIAPALGVAAAGCSLLVLEWLANDDGRRR